MCSPPLEAVEEDETVVEDLEEETNREPSVLGLLLSLLVVARVVTVITLSPAVDDDFATMW